MWSSKFWKILGLTALATTPFTVNSDYNPLTSNPIQSISARDVWILTDEYVNERCGKSGITELYVWVKIGNTEKGYHELATINFPNQGDLENILGGFSREDFDVAYMTGEYARHFEEINPALRAELPKELIVSEIRMHFDNGEVETYPKTNL